MKNFTLLRRVHSSYLCLGLLFLLISVLNTSGQNCSVNAGIDGDICINEKLFLKGSYTEPLQTGADAVWTQVEGPAATIVDPLGLETEVKNLIAGETYTFRISTTCGDGAFTFQDVTYTILEASIANAGDDATYCPGDAANLSASAPGTNETGQWTGGGNGISIDDINDPNSSLTISGGNSGSATLRWTISNDNGCNTFDEVIITNRGGVSPVSAGADQDLSYCYSSFQSTQLQGSYAGSGIDGQIGKWTIISGPNVPAINNPNANNTSVTNLIEGTYVFRWTVDGPCVSGVDEVVINVPAPTADITNASAGADQVFCDVSRTSTVLNGNSTLYINEDVEWVQTSGPPATIVSPNSPVTQITGMSSPNSYSFRYTISNPTLGPDGCSSSDVITVSYLPNPPSLTIDSDDPIINDCGENTATIDFTAGGSGTSQFRILSGPTGSGFSFPTGWTNAGTSPLTITGLTASGIYIVEMRRVTATGIDCVTQFDQISIVVSETTIASNPGTDQILNCNVTTTDLVGNDPGSLVGTWSQVSGPTEIILTNIHSPVLTIENLQPDAVYVFRWLISGGPYSETSQQDISVITASTEPTAVGAGNDQTVCSNTPIYLDAEYPTYVFEIGTWSVNPSDGVTFSDVNDPKAIVYGLDANETYTFTWTISNGCGSSSNTMTVDVSGEEGPIEANAGPDQCLSTGTTTIQLDGNDPAPGSGQWYKVSGPGTATFANDALYNTTVDVSADGNYQFEWVISSGVGCNPTRDTVEVKIDAPVTTADAGANQEICGNEVTLTGNIPTIGTPQWMQISGNAGYTIQSPNSNSTLVTGLTSGVYVFEYTISNGVCTSSDLVTIYVSEPPSTADAGDDKDLCGESSTTMNALAPAGGTGLWSVISGPNTPNIVDQDSPTTTVSNLITGTYTLQWTISGGIFCPSSSDTAIITVVREADAGADQSYCEEITAVNLTGTTASSGTWSQVSGPNTSTITLTAGNTATASDLIPGVYEFEYEITATGCSTADTMTVTLFEPPSTADAGTDFEVCDAASFSLNATPPASGTGTWSVLSGPTGGSFDDVNAPNVTFSNPGYGVYIFQWTVANGDCSNADQVRFTNYQPPSTANAGSDLDVTCDTVATMAANDPVVGVGEWTFVSKLGDGPDPVITSSILYNTTITNLGPQTDGNPETYTFLWTISNGGECTPTSDEVDITVYEIPTKANAGSDQELCEQSSVTLNAVPATTGSGTWSQISPSVTTESITTPSDSNTTVTGLVAGETYVFEWTTETSFCSSSDQVTITNWEAPTIASASDITECLYQTVNLTGNTPAIGTGVWTQTAGTSIIIDDPSSPTSAIYGLTAGTYSFKWTISNGPVCTPSEAEINVEILALPTIADAGDDQFLCDVANTTLEGNTASVGTGTWTFVSGGTGATITDDTDPTTTVTNLAVGTHRLRWTISNGCADYFDEVNITRYPDLQVTGPIASSTYCIGGSEALSVNASGGDGIGYSYQWYQSSSSGGPWSAISGATNATYNTPTSLSSGDYYYYAEVTNCTTVESTEAHLTIVDDPVVTTDPVGADYCSPATHSMSVAATGDAGAGTLSYQWQTRNGTTGAWTNISGATSTNYTIPELTATAPDSFIKQYRVRVVQTASGCETFSGAATVTIHPIPSVTSSASKTICNEDVTNYSITSDVTGTTFVWTAALQSGTATGFSDGTGSLIDQTLTNSTTSPAVVRYTITPTGPAPTNCIGSDFTLDVTVNPTPDVIASPTSERICSNTATNIALSTNITGTTVTYSWTASLISGSASGFSNNSGNSIQETLTNSGNTEAVVRYTITPSIGSCTGTPITVDITVNPSGQVNDVSDQVVCNNGSTSGINFSTSRTDGTTTYEWTNDNTSIGLNVSGSGDILSFTAINSGTTPVTATVTVTPTYTNGSLSCEGPSKDFTITVNPTAQVDNPGTQILCNQASASVNFTTDRTGGSTSYSWTNDNPSIGLGASGNGNLSFTATNTGTSPISANIEVTPTFSNGGENCSGPSEIFTITVNPSGQVNTIDDQQLCNGSATSEVTFSTNRTPGTTTYEWTNDTPSIGLPGSGDGDIPSFTAVNNGTDLINATITITPYYEGCAGATEQFVYTVYPTPVVSSESEIIVCSGETLDYEITSETPGTTFNWTATNNVGTVTGFTPTGTSSTISDDLANAGAADGKVTYTIVPTANSCSGPEFKLEVTVLNCNPKIGVAKQLVSTSYNEDGTVDVLFNIRVQNYGNVVLDSIQVVEDLATAFSGNYEVLELSSTSFDVNTSFDGNTDQNLLSNSGTTNVLTVGASSDINLKVKVLTAGSYSNQVTASSPSSGGTIDDSQNGSDPDDGSSTLSENGDEEPGNNNEPTPVEIGSCTLTANVTQNTTCGNAAGSVTLTGSSAGTVTLNGVEKASPAAYSGLQAGWYSAYYTTDANGCIAVANFEITNSNSDLEASVTAHTNVSCNGGNDGAVTVTPTGGTSPYSFELNGSSESSGTFTGLSAGEYGAKITDANGCTYTVSFDIDEPTELIAQIVSSTNESCFDAADGNATVDVTGGTTPYSYLWSNGQTSATAVGLADGSYTVTVTDAGGCTVEDIPVTIGGANAVLAVTGSTTDLTCNGDNSGEIDITVTGGTAPYSYVWSNGLSTEDISNLPAGDYSVTVTDANGCNVTSETFSLTQPAALSLTARNIVNTECNASVGEVTIEEASGTAGTFTVNEVNVTGTSATFTNLPAGYYTATFVATVTGCTAETSFNIINSNSDLAGSVTAHTNVSCNGGNDGAVTVTPTGGTSPYSFELNGSSESNGTFTGLSAGEYGAKITDANGCTYTVSFDIDEPTELIAQIVSSTYESCFDAADGNATVDVTGGTTPYSYLWSNGQTSATAVGLADGSYTVTVTDAGGCTVEDIPVTIGGANAVLAVTGSTTDLTCNGDNSGEIDITVTGGTAPYSYVWSNGLSTEDISNLPAGDYSVTVTDANGCNVTSETFSLTQPAALSLTARNIVNTECNASVGEVTIEEASGTAGTFTVNEVNVTGTSATFTNLPAGYYTATFVATVTGCTAETSFNIINSNSDLAGSVTSHTDVSCFGGSDGAVTVTPTGGTSPYSFELNGSSESNGTFTGLSAGEYGAKITDANGCTYTVSFDIDEPTELIAQIVSSTNESCFDAADGNATVDVTGGTTPYSYLWSNGQTSATAVGLADGSYTVTVTDAGGCTVEDIPVTIGGANAVLAVTGSTTDLTCNGDNSGEIDITVTGGTAPYSYVWSNGLSTEDISNLPAGDYSVTVTDANGCNVTSETFSLTQPAALSLTARNIVNTECNASVGEVTIEEASGTAGTFTVNEVNVTGTSATFTNLPAGYYTATFVATVTGCTAETSFNIINSNSYLEASVTAHTNVSCNGGNDGAVTVTPTGGTSPYSFELNGSSESNGTFTGLSAGEYGAKITDANGCTYTVSFDIDEPSELFAEIVSSTDVSCNGSADGTATVNVSGGTTPYTYAWNDGSSQTTSTATGLAANNYTVTVTDANGCTTTASVTIDEAAALSASTNVVANVLCYGESTGVASVTPVGGTSPYSYIWETGSTDSIASGLTAGSYDVRVIDANGCETTSSVTITEPGTAVSAVINTADVTQPSCEGNIDGEATVTASGGTSPYTYRWSDGQTDATATGLTAGYYEVTVTDDNGCSATTSVLLNDPTGITATITAVTHNDCYNGTSGSATVTADGGSGSYTYSWSDGQTTATAINLAEGTYTVTVDDGSCTAQAFVEITAPDSLFAEIISSTDVSCNGGADGTATVNVSGGTTPYTYAWNDGSSQTTATATDLSAGTYQVTVTDANGCTTTASISIDEPENPLEISSATPTNPTCYDAADGSVEITVNGGTTPYSFVWNNGQASQNATGLTEGNYSVTVTDSLGCTVTGGPYNLISPDSYTVSAGKDSAICSSETITLEGTSNVGVQWTTSGTGTFDDSTLLNAEYTPSKADISDGQVQLTLTTDVEGSCDNISNQIVLTIWKQPTAYAGIDAVSATGEPYQVLDAEAANYSSVDWTHDGLGTLSGASTLSPVYTPGNGETGIISLILEVFPEGGDICSSAKDTMTISIGEEPEISVEKRTVQVVLNDDGSTDITFEFNVENTGNVDLSNISIVDDLVTTFPGSCNVSVLSLTSDNFNVNESFDGVLDTQILATGNTLEVLAKKAVLLSVKIDGCNASQTSFTNEAVVQGTSAGNETVTDTDLSFISIEENPIIGLAKQLINTIANGDGTYSLTFNIRVSNYGTVSLRDIVVEDNLDVVFGAGNYAVETITSEYFAVNESYTGGFGENLLADNNYLEPSETGAIQLKVTVLSSGNYSNQAEASGISPIGTEVSDSSQSGTDPDPDGDGDPTNNDETTDIDLEECISTLNCPDQASYVIQVTPNECGYRVVGDEFDATTAGDCELVSLTHDYELWNSSTLAGAILPVGTTTITWTAEFASGNTLSCPITIVVEDNSAPYFVNCPSGTTFTVGLFSDACEGGAIWSIPVANDNCSQVEVTQIEGPARGELLEVGLYTIAYQAEDEAGNIETCSFNINVIDTEDPVVVCQPNIIMDADAGSCSWKSPSGSLSPLLANSNCKAEVSWKVVGPDGIQTNGKDDVSGFEFDLGTSTVYYTITESVSGQNWDCSFTVAVEDSEVPVIECQPTLEVTANAGACTAVVDLVAPTSADNCSSGLDVFFRVFGPDNLITDEYNYATVNSYEFKNGISQIEWKVVDKAGNQSSCWQNIWVSPDIDALIPDAGENVAICNSDVYTTEASAPDYADVTWTTTGTGTFADASQAITIYTPSQNDINDGFVILTITSSIDCASSSDQMMLILSQPPQVAAGADQSICETDLVQLSGSIISSSASVVWSTSGTGTFSDSHIFNPVYTPSDEDIEAGQVDLTFRGVTGGTCASHEDVVTVFIDRLPAVSAGDDAWICQEESYLLFDASFENAETILWTTSGTGYFNNKAAVNPVYTPSASDIANGGAVLTVTVTPAGPCNVVSDEMKLNISKASSVDAGENMHTCYNTEIVITGANASNYATLVWATTGLGTLQDAETLNPTYVPADDETGVITLTLTITSGPGCSAETMTDSTELEILPPLIVDIGDDETIFNNTPISLSAEVFNGTNSYFYQWEPASSVVDPNSNTTETVELMGTTSFEISVIDAITGCTAYDNMTVYVEDQAESIVQFYRGFSPNGDGTNDTWTIKGIDKFPLNKVMIFNRWGDKVRELYNYNNTSVVWDGTNDEGKELPDGTYYYIVELRNVEEFTGWVHIRSDR